MNYLGISKFIEKNIINIILFTYFFYMFYFYFFPDNFIFNKDMKVGYLLGGDSKRYILGSEKILNSELPARKSYIGYMTFIAFFKYFKFDLSYVVISQIFLSALSALCIYKISLKLSTKLGGIVGIMLYLFYLPIQVWNFYILTETLFICSIIFIVFFLIFFKKKYIPIIIFLLLYTVSIRPHGIILLPSFILAFIIWCYIKKDIKIFWLSISITIILLYPIFLILNLYLADQNIENMISNTGIIWGYNEISNNSEFKISNNYDNNFISLIVFFYDNKYIILSSFFKKIWFFFARVRPYYSELHNFYIIIFNFLYYPLAVYGMIKLKNKKSLGVILIYILIIAFTLTAGFTFADWDSRFSLYIIPLIFIFASIGFTEIYNLIKKIEK